MKKILSSRGLKVALIGAAIAATGAAVAGEPGHQRFHQERGGHQACAPHGGPGFHHGHLPGAHYGVNRDHGVHDRHMKQAGLVIPGYGIVSQDFVDGMGLNADQLKLVEEARSAGEALRKNLREQFSGGKKNIAERFASGSIDPEKALKQADERRARIQAERSKVDEKWIAVWKSLDASQQARVTEHLKQRAERVQKRAEERKERAEKRQERREQRDGAKAPRQGETVSS